MSGPNSPAQVARSERREELNNLASDFVDAFNRQDLDEVMSYFSESAVYEDSYGETHIGPEAIRKTFEPIFDGRLGRICFEGDDRFIDAGQGKVMDSWRLRMHIGESNERVLRGLDLLHFEGRKLVRKITYKQD